ncbi:MAG TPA: phosphatase PAP2 family protein [Thermoanaerobaculia bacterium]|jgi:membrane-associated phospholipid phosphatase|nr:phosphatase PAP2 family protein [Thermoanaerobaculia bacterium]
MTILVTFALLFALLWLFFYATGPLFERLLRRSAHWTAAFRYRDYLPVFVVLGIGIAAAAVAGNAFVELAELVQENSPQLHSIDEDVHAWATATREQGTTGFFTLMTIIGTPVGLGAIATLVAIGLGIRKRWRWAAYLFLTSAIGGLLNLQLKAWFARARPELAEALRDAHGYSFPSGHAMGSTIVFGALAYLAFRIITRWRWRAAALAFACSMILSIAASRIYLGVHWISDVAAGIAAGLIWLAAVTVAYETFRRIRLVRALRTRHDESLSSERTSRGV